MNDEIIDLLTLWWRYESQYNPVRGFSPECSSTRGYRASRQYDDSNEAMETDLRGRKAREVGHIIANIPDPWRTALHIFARNRVLGIDVWSSPKLPGDRCREITSEALDMFSNLV